jgi:hypothetical protein
MRDEVSFVSRSLHSLQLKLASSFYLFAISRLRVRISQAGQLVNVRGLAPETDRLT